MKTMNMKYNKQIKGFTLIELLVVIAIIAILAVIGLTVLQGQQVKARDARRKGDIDAIANAWEAHYAVGQYPAMDVNWLANGQFPSDPSLTATNLANYVYSTVDTSADYTAAQLITNPQSMTWARTAATPTTPATPGGGYSAWGTLGDASPGAAHTRWIICTLLEAAANTQYCRASGQ